MKLTAILLIVLMITGISVCALASVDEAQTAAESADATIQPTAEANANGNTFRLEWYHYIIPVVIIFAMTLFTSNSIKPLKK